MTAPATVRCGRRTVSGSKTLAVASTLGEIRYPSNIRYIVRYQSKNTKLRKRSRCFRSWIRDEIGPGEAWLTNITTCHTSKSGARCHQSRTLPAVSSSMVASVLTVHVMLHMANAIRRPPQTVDRTLQFFPKICQLIHSPPSNSYPPNASIPRRRAQHKSAHFWHRRCRDFDLKQYLVVR